jgi:hypothetical protein
MLKVWFVVCNPEYLSVCAIPRTIDELGLDRSIVSGNVIVGFQFVSSKSILVQSIVLKN